MKGNREQKTINVEPIKPHTPFQNFTLEDLDLAYLHIRLARGYLFKTCQTAHGIPNGDVVQDMLAQVLKHQDQAKVYIRDKIVPEVKRG